MWVQGDVPQYQETPDYTYDQYSDWDWHDEAPSPGEPSEQDLALAQLMLDHIAGKYSLEDLETLEREARMEETSETQLRDLTKQVRPCGKQFNDLKPFYI